MSLILGCFTALLKVFIDRYFWNTKRQKLFHTIGFLSVLIIFGIGYITCNIDFTTYIFSYWNIFEIATNLTHKQKIFYIGGQAYTDKILKRIRYYIPNIKQILHIITTLYICYHYLNAL